MQIHAVDEGRGQCRVRFWNGSTLAAPRELTLWVSEEHYHVAEALLVQLHGSVE